MQPYKNKNFYEFTIMRRKCVTHARELASTGELVFHAGSYNTALDLGLSSLEELGKIFMVFSNYYDQSIEPKKIDIKNHVDKLAWALVAALNESGIDLKEKNYWFAEISVLLHRKRQEGQYVDVFKMSVDSPVKDTPVELARSVLMMAYAAIMLEEDRIWKPSGYFSLASYPVISDNAVKLMLKMHMLLIRNALDI